METLLRMLGGFAMGSGLFSLPAVMIMAYVVHGATDGKGDGSLMDSLVLALVILAPFIGAWAGFFWKVRCS